VLGALDVAAVGGLHRDLGVRPVTKGGAMVPTPFDSSAGF
jgi:hypothetical protein